MDEFLTGFLVKEIKIGKILLTPLDLLLLVGMTVSGIMLRYSVAGYSALPDSGSYLALETGLKMTGYVFDFALAVLLGVLTRRLTGHMVRALLAYGIAFVLPVFVSGSAMWGMGDSIYLFFLLCSFGLLLLEKRQLSLLVYGVSVFFHPYALFLLPLYILLTFRGEMPVWCFLSPLAGSILRMVLPLWGRMEEARAALEGSKLRMVLCAKGFFPPFAAERLLLESRGERLLSYNCPNLFQIIGTDKFVMEYEKVALVFSLGLTLILLAVLSYRQMSLEGEMLFRLALLFCLFLPYTMPGMHERSLLPACLVSLFYGFVYLRRFYLPILLTTAAYISYSAYFRGESVVPLAGVAFVWLALLVWLMRSVYLGSVLSDQ